MYIDDDIHFSFKDIAPIRDDDEYGGYRASIEGVLETIITPMQSLYLFANKEHLKMALQATAITVISNKNEIINTIPGFRTHNLQHNKLWYLI